MKYELTGHFEYSDPYEPVGFEFDEETIKKLKDIGVVGINGFVESLSDLVDVLDPDADEWKNEERAGYRLNGTKIPKFRLTVEELKE